MTGTAAPRHAPLGWCLARARSAGDVRTSATPVAQLVRFAVMGGLANGLYLGIVLLGGAGGADVQALNAVGTASSTVLANELHRRYTFRSVGRSSALAVHLAGSGTAAAGLAASAAALAGYQHVAPDGPPWGTAAVGLTVGSAVGFVRFLVLRAVSTRDAALDGTRPLRRRPSPPAGRAQPRRRSIAAAVLVSLVIWPLGGAVCAAATADDGTALLSARSAGSDVGSGSTPRSRGPAAGDAATAARDAFAAAAGGSSGTLAALVIDGAQPPRVPTAHDVRTRLQPREEGAWLADRPFPTASLVKLYLAEGILSSARLAGVPLAAADGALLDAMLTRSDDDAASRLWVRHDGAAQVAAVAQRYGLTSTAPPARPGAWGQATTSARDVGRFLSALPWRAHPDDAARVLRALARATPTGADGFDQRFGLLAADVASPGTPVKQGWMCCVDGARHLHSVGMVGERVVVLLAEVPAATDWTRLRGYLDAAARAALAR